MTGGGGGLAWNLLESLGLKRRSWKQLPNPASSEPQSWLWHIGAWGWAAWGWGGCRTSSWGCDSVHMLYLDPQSTTFPSWAMICANSAYTKWKNDDNDDDLFACRARGFHSWRSPLLNYSYFRTITTVISFFILWRYQISCTPSVHCQYKFQAQHHCKQATWHRPLYSGRFSLLRQGSEASNQCRHKTRTHLWRKWWWKMRVRSREHQAASHSIKEAMCAGRVAPGVLPDLLRHPKNLSPSHHSRAIQSHSLIPPRSGNSTWETQKDLTEHQDTLSSRVLS